MGNLFGMIMKLQAVHPWRREAEGWRKVPAGSCGGVRIKVRMTTAELKEVTEAVDLSKGGSDLGRLIMRELSEGKYQARVVACGDLTMPEKKSVGLSSISEEEKEDVDVDADADADDDDE